MINRRIWNNSVCEIGLYTIVYEVLVVLKSNSTWAKGVFEI